MDKTYNIQHIREKDYKYSRIIQDLLNKNGWTSVTNKATYSDKNSTSLIKTYLDGTDSMFYKHKLAKKFKKYVFINPFYKIDKEKQLKELNKLPEYIDHDSIWFLKASDLLVGAGEEIDLLKFNKGDIFRDRIKKLIKPKYSYILQKNIHPPLLFNGYKFDLRLIGVIVYTPTELASYILDKANIKYAMSKYSTDPTDPLELKLSLMTSVGNVKKMSDNEKAKLNPEPTAMFDSNHTYYKYLQNIINVYACIVKCCFKNIKKEKTKSDSKGDSGFIIISIDAMMDADGNVYIIEINAHPSLYNDSSSIDKAYNYKYHHGLNWDIFKHFYGLVFQPILENKLIDTNYHNWIMSNHYSFDKPIKCQEKIIVKQDRLGLYKFALTIKDIDRFNHFMMKQPGDYKIRWGLISKSEIAELIGKNYKKNDIILGIIKEPEKKIIGIIGISHKNSKYQGVFKNNWFTSIIIDHTQAGKGYGKEAYKIFFKWLKNQIEKGIFDIKDDIYASIYKDNVASIKLHEKIGFKFVGNGFTSKTNVYKYHL